MIKEQIPFTIAIKKIKYTAINVRNGKVAYKDL